MAGGNSFRDLVVWQLSMDLAEAIYELTNQFPDSERFGLVTQLKRASISVPSNIAEGHGRNSRGEFKQFLGIARGSLREVETQLELGKRLKMAAETDVNQLLANCDRIARALYALEKSLSRPKDT